ncbi:flagellar biosynthetic protein FliR [Paucidesulfovibrio gracilis DSM 16080]|uniref:Flagellar biosynthetic protein FliR n=1 Tax=Paucidesulfovibrio gracilis DSM 16080 TaxID=1121449 RepID=A0A1T4XC47_9BACT|nr:flagellar biosynthetic protein FliR [Paucidesulfovibrio gracilis]SKA87096.1 flagellar biosynthetic protein FliR [Paucidesulfovibrio gracilis DSM 16080]
MDIFNFDPNKLLSFYLTLFRFSVVLFLLPFFGGKTVPKPVKAALVLVLSLAVWPDLSFPGSLMPGNPWEIIIMFLGELLMGLIMGMMVQFLFAAIQTGGQLIGFQMGFAMVNVVDPLTGTSEAVTAHFLYMIAMLTFLALNGPLHLLNGVAESFKLVPPGSLLLTPEAVNQVLDFSKQIFVLAIRIAAPIMAALFMVDLALALIGRAAPQMHVLVLGFPIKISVGFFFLGMLFDIMATYVGNYIQALDAVYINLFRALGPGTGG